MTTTKKYTIITSIIIGVSITLIGAIIMGGFNARDTAKGAEYKSVDLDKRVQIIESTMVYKQNKLDAELCKQELKEEINNKVDNKLMLEMMSNNEKEHKTLTDNIKSIGEDVKFIKNYIITNKQ